MKLLISDLEVIPHEHPESRHTLRTNFTLSDSGRSARVLISWTFACVNVSARCRRLSSTLGTAAEVVAISC